MRSTKDVSQEYGGLKNMILAKYSVSINGQLRKYKTPEEVIINTGRWIKIIDENAEFEINFFAGLFVKIRWFGNELDIRKIDTMMERVRRNMPMIFSVSRVNIEIYYFETGG